MGFARPVLGKDNQYPVVPVIYKDIDHSLLLHVVGAVDLTIRNKELRQKELQKLLNKQGIAESGPDDPISIPYPGMSAFKVEDAHLFFGREDKINQCIDYLQENRLLALTGVSGCGKSSLVNAGIIPRLKRHENWLIKTIRPSSFLDNYPQKSNPAIFFSFFPDLSKRQKPLLFIDQFEEIFTFDLDDADIKKKNGLTSKVKEFLQCLSMIADQIYIILTIRDEFYPQIAWCREWLNIDPHLQRVDFIGVNGLVDAIRKPAASQGVYIDKVLIERLVNDAGHDPAILPFVQETMRKLWERMDDRYIDIEDYEALQGYGVSGLKYAIAAKADSAYKSLPSDEHRTIARRMFIRLVQFGEGKPDTRRQLSVSKLQVEGEPPHLFDQTLSHLSSEKNRLLTLSGDKESIRRVDIIHESLIEGWGTLREWLSEFREDDKFRRKLDFKAAEWIRLDKDKSCLLGSKEVNEARVWLDKPVVKSLGLSGLAKEYVDESIRYLNPGWSKRGIMYFILYTIIAFFSLALAYVVIDFYQSPFFLRWSWLLFMVPIFLFFYFYRLFKKQEEAAFEKLLFSLGKDKTNIVWLSFLLMAIPLAGWVFLEQAESKEQLCSEYFSKDKRNITHRIIHNSRNSN